MGFEGFSAPFIRRLVATTLLTLAITLAGMLGFRELPVAPLPQVDFPTILVQASLPGASPETMAATVATPLERALGRIAGVSEMTSSSSTGSTRIILQFDLSRDIDGAARDVQAAINAARTLLPSSLPSNPTYRKVNPASAPIAILAVTSDTVDRAGMYDVASTILAQKISQVSGVGQVDVGGSSLPAVRVELDPRNLDKLGLSSAQVRAAIAANNANRPKGQVEDGARHWQVGANDQSRTAAEYAPLIVAWRGNAPVRLSDIGTVEDSMQDLRHAGLSNGKAAVVLLVRQQPGANIVDTVDQVRELLPQLRASIPASINVDLVMDRSITIRAGLHEVERTLVIAVVLVVLVVFAFLRSVRAASLPAVAVPVSLIGSFAVMYLAGYSLNTLTLMALTVATGFVVDDAVVVVENVSRHLERGVEPFAAALAGAREVGFTVLSMSLSLIAVFIPILFMGGIVGRFFREFAATLSVAVAVSLLVSLTTTPMMAARLLRRPDEAHAGRVSRLAARAFERLLAGYAHSLEWALRHRRFTMLVLLATICVNVFLYAVVPKGFLPQQDTGRLIGGFATDQDTSFQATTEKLARFAAILRTDPAVENVVGFTGGGRSNGGFIFATLKPLAERKASADAIIGRMRARLSHVPGARLFLQAAQDVRVGGRASDAQYQYTLQSDDLAELRAWEPRIRVALSHVPEITDVTTDEEDRGLKTMLDIDRAAAARLGVDVRMIDATLDDLFAQRQVATIYNPLNQYKVVMEAAPRFTEGPEILRTVHVINAAGEAIPLSAFARWAPTPTALSVNHQGLAVASTVAFNLAPGVALSQADRAIRTAMVGLGVPESIRGGFQGTAKAYQDTTRNQPFLILAALLTVYIVLGVLYESYVHPITILSTLPSAGVGALLALLALRVPLDLIGLIGVILLIGIVKKNAIMMIDVAVVLQREQHMDALAAIREACVRRFRPIMMTTLAAMFGAMPLVLGSGEGAELRRPLGIAIVGGLAVSQLLTLYTTPVVYLYMEKARDWVMARVRRHRGEPAVVR